MATKNSLGNSADNRAGNNEPYLSILVVGYSMSRQLANTLYSLGCKYQVDVDEHDYEVVVVENESDDTLSEDCISSLPSNFSYHRRPSDSVSPVSAIEFGLKHCLGDSLGIILDGAQLITPGAVKYALMAFKLAEEPLVVLPGYHLGEAAQHQLDDVENFVEQQDKFLEESDWRSNGYRLFEWACFSPGNQNGFLHPLMECSAFFCSKAAFIEVDGADHRFQYAGGGAINLHLYRKLGLRQSCSLFLLAGEGTFHQYHGGVTTSREGYEEKVARFNVQLQDIWQGKFNALRREPTLLGAIGELALPFLYRSSELAEKRFNRLSSSKLEFWADDAPEMLTE